MIDEHTPRVVLIGMGRFGRNYYSEIVKLEQSGKLFMKGVVTQSGLPPTGIEVKHRIISSNSFVREPDQFAATHYVIVVPPCKRRGIVEVCLQRGKVLLEKPAYMDYAQLKELNEASRGSVYPLLIAQIFRLHPQYRRLLSCLKDSAVPIKYISGHFVNAIHASPPPEYALRNISAEMNHMIDLSLLILGFDQRRPVSRSRVQLLEGLQIPTSSNDAYISSTAGWADVHYSQRTLKVVMGDESWYNCDFSTGIFSAYSSGKLLKYLVPQGGSLIASQLMHFIGRVSDDQDSLYDYNPLPSYTFSFSETAEYAAVYNSHRPITPFLSIPKKNVVVIGGGIFGATAAIKLAQGYRVTLLERNNMLLAEATLKNQWRHHSGFHYPLSYETNREIRECKTVFEQAYSECIVRDVPSYYFVSRWASEIPPERYLSSMNLFGLRYEIVQPPSCVNPTSVKLSLLTDECIYDVGALRNIVVSQLEDLDVNVQLGMDVLSIDVLEDKKSITAKALSDLDNCYQYDCDFVVDCTNGMPTFAVRHLPSFRPDVRLELVELVEIEADFPSVCLTFIDAPFLSLTSMGSGGNSFMLSHRDHSLHQRLYLNSPEDIKSRMAVSPISNNRNIITAATEYMPSLADAKVIRSRYAWKGIAPYTKEIWERPTLIRDHGHGVISVIAGKILTSVSNADSVKSIIDAYS